MIKDFKVGIDFSALDPTFKEHSTRGIGKYAREFKKFLEKNTSTISYGYFNHREVLANSCLAKLIDLAPAGRQTLKQQLLYPFKLSGAQLKKFSHLHFLAQTDAPTWCAKPYILTVMDLIPIVCKDLYQADNPNWRYHLARFFELQAIKNSSQIITISECSKNDLIHQLQIPAEKISVTPLGVDAVYFENSNLNLGEILAKYNLAADLKFLLYVGGIDPRKNFSGLLVTYAELKKLYQEKHLLNNFPKLFLVGRINQDREYPKLKALIDQLALVDDVLELGFVADAELITLYQNCEAMCFFSLYEGFGLTPLEAMAAGATVFSTKLSAMPEVLGDVAHYLDPRASEQNAKEMFEVIRNPEQRKIDRVAGPLQAQKFTWNRTWDLTLKVYEDAARSN